MNQARAEPLPRPAAGAGPPQGLELRHLRYFVAIADAGTCTHAAERLFIAQSALRQQMQRLEQIAGTPPLQRRRDRVRLTAEGTVLLEAAREFEPDVRISSPHPAARCGVIGPDDLAGLDLIRGPRRASPATYDRWLQVLRTVDPRFEFTGPPFRSLPTALAFAATASRPGALLTGPAVTAGPLPGVIRLAARRAPATWPGSASPLTR